MCFLFNVDYKTSLYSLLKYRLQEEQFCPSTGNVPKFQLTPAGETGSPVLL